MGLKSNPRVSPENFQEILPGTSNSHGLAHFHSKTTNSKAQLKIMQAAENCGP